MHPQFGSRPDGRGVPSTLWGRALRGPQSGLGPTEIHPLTPAGFVSHNVSRNNYSEIATEILTAGKPEYAALSSDGATAWVTLQENNALAIVDVQAMTATQLVALGYKDYSGYAGLDPSDKDGGEAITNWPVMGMYQPGGIAAYQTLERIACLGGYDVDPENDGDIDVIYNFGARSFDAVVATAAHTRLAAVSQAVAPLDFDIFYTADDRTEAARLTGRTSNDAVAKLVSRFNAEGIGTVASKHGGGPAIVYGRALSALCQPLLTAEDGHTPSPHPSRHMAIIMSANPLA